MSTTTTRHSTRQSPTASGTRNSGWGRPQVADSPAPLSTIMTIAQFKARLDNIIQDARRVLDDIYARQWGCYKHPEKIVERLDAQLKHCIVMRSLLELGMSDSELRQFQQNEIDFVRGVELFLEQLGAQQLRETPSLKLTGLL